MADTKPPFSSNMGDVAEPKIQPNIFDQLPNREIRRKAKKMQKKPHFQAEVAKNLGAEQQMSPSPDVQAELLKNLDVQKFLGILNDLLTGKKKLVIETTKRGDGTGRQRHTFLVEDANG